MLSVAVSGCASMGRSVGLGAGAGAAAGATTGALVHGEDRGKAALIGGLIGAGVGAGSSFLIHKGLESRDSSVRNETLLNLDKFGVTGVSNHRGGRSRPAITFPVVEEQQVETQVKGKKLIEGHRVWVISEDPKWMLEEPSK